MTDEYDSDASYAAIRDYIRTVALPVSSRPGQSRAGISGMRPADRETGHMLTAGIHPVPGKTPVARHHYVRWRESRRGYSSPENRSHADWRVIWRAAPMRAQVTLRSRKMVTSR